MSDFTDRITPGSSLNELGEWTDKKIGNQPPIVSLVTGTGRWLRKLLLG